MVAALDIARTILAGFDKHYRLFREASARARYLFVRGHWSSLRAASAARIPMYDQRVGEACDTLRELYPEEHSDETLWPEVKIAYIGLLHEHKQPECAETFYNSVACRVLDRRYYKNAYLFRRPTLSTEHIDGEEPTYRCHYPRERGLRGALRDILLGFGMAYRDLDRDLRRLVHAIRERFPRPFRMHDNLQIQVLSSLFFRGRTAYAVGRAINGTDVIPFVAPLLRADDGSVVVDTLLLKAENIGRVFSLSRAYFMADMEVPAAYVSFLATILPNKPKAELYTLLGLQKQGKTLFYRDLVDHMRHSSDRFTAAPGARGMVMAVFTMPSFAYVFKVIRDWFEPPKDCDKKSVRERYLFVKYHDRAGRMADTLEYSNVALPLARFDPAIVAELQRVAPSEIEIDTDAQQIVIRHVYIERRMTPLDVFLRAATPPQARAALDDYGAAIGELASANIFAGDLLPKNFGVTRYGRVVFYDYDEIVPLVECEFRRLPAVAGVGPRDVFPEELAQFLLPRGRLRELFVELHPELEDPAFWIGLQDRIRAGAFVDALPYPAEIRFERRFG